MVPNADLARWNLACFPPEAESKIGNSSVQWAKYPPQVLLAT
jgi:hypothetical protein